MINKVTWLEELSQTNKLCSGCDEEGKMNGNMLTPTVPIIPATDSALLVKASSGLRTKNVANSAPKMPKAGTIKVTGTRW